MCFFLLLFTYHIVQVTFILYIYVVFILAQYPVYNNIRMRAYTIRSKQTLLHLLFSYTHFILLLSFVLSIFYSICVWIQFVSFTISLLLYFSSFRFSLCVCGAWFMRTNGMNAFFFKAKKIKNLYKSYYISVWWLARFCVLYNTTSFVYLLYIYI